HRHTLFPYTTLFRSHVETTRDRHIRTRPGAQRGSARKADRAAASHKPGDSGRNGRTVHPAVEVRTVKGNHSRAMHCEGRRALREDRKSTRLNSSHLV